jgi:hypothetical protein
VFHTDQWLYYSELIPLFHFLLMLTLTLLSSDTCTRKLVKDPKFLASCVEQRHYQRGVNFSVSLCGYINTNILVIRYAYRKTCEKSEVTSVLCMSTFLLLWGYFSLSVFDYTNTDAFFILYTYRKNVKNQKFQICRCISCFDLESTGKRVSKRK